MKILHISGKSSFDGTSIFPFRIVKYFPNDKHTLLFIYRGNAQKEMENECKNILNIFPDSPKLSFVRKILALIKLIPFFNKFDIIHYHSGGILVLLFIHIFARNKKIIQHLHCRNINCSRTRENLTLIEIFFYKVVGRRNYIVASSLSALQYYRAIIGENTRTYLIENSAPIIFKKKERFTFTIGYLGQISQEKGIYLLFKLFKELPDHNFILKGDIIDSGIRNGLKQFRNIKIEEPCLEVSDFLKRIDILIFPSTSVFETSPLVIWESFFNDIPVIINRNSIGGSSFENYEFAFKNLKICCIINAINNYYTSISQQERLSNYHLTIYNKNNFSIFKSKMDILYKTIISDY